MSESLRIVAVEPTIFFARSDSGLAQVVRLTIENDGPARAGTVELEASRARGTAAIVTVAPGRETYSVHLPDVREPEEVVLRLATGETLHDEQHIQWQPMRHWQVYLTHYSHHDLGYTDIPSHVLAEHDGFIDQALSFCEATADWPDDARFRYLCEQAWSVMHYLESAPPANIERLLYCIKNGQIEAPALFGNQILELHGHEELIRLLYPSFNLKRRYGIEIASALHNDIPGLAWGLASVLAGAGVHYLSVGVPLWYFGDGDAQVHPLWDRQAVFPMDIPAAAWWQGPDGARVLLWSDPHGREWQPYTVSEVERDLTGMLGELETRAYPYDMVRYTLRGGHRDNAPPTLRYAEIVRAWNEHWAYPRLINATNASFLRAFGQRWGASLRILRGDAPGTDYPVAASCTPRETAVARTTHELLLDAERWATIASALAGYDYPRPALDEAYKQVFSFDEHCWGMSHIGGPAMDAHVSEKVTAAYRGNALAHDVAIKATNKLADHISYPAEGLYLTVFNSLPHARSEVVRAPLRSWSPCTSLMHWQPPQAGQDAPRLVSGGAIGRRITDPPADILDRPFEIVDAGSGRSVPFQIAEASDPQAAQPWAAERVALAVVDPRHRREIVFVADDLPPVGYRTYRLVPGAERHGDAPALIQAGDRIIVDSRFVRLVVDTASGDLVSIFDKELGRELVDGGAPHGFGRLIARQCASATEEVDRLAEVHVVDNGPLFTTIRLKSVLSCCPRCTREITVYHTLKRIDLSASLLRDVTPNVEVYMAFPFAVNKPCFRFEASGAIMEPIVDQLPGSNTDYYGVQHWASVHNDEWGIVWAPLDTAMAAFGGLWPGYVSSAHHGATGPGYGHPFARAGEWIRSHIYALLSYNNFRTNFVNVHAGQVIVRYALSAHRGDWRTGKAYQFGWRALHPPQVVWTHGPQSGSLPGAGSFCSVDAHNVVLLALKKAEDGRGYIVRLAETEGIQTEATVTLPFVTIAQAMASSLVEEDLYPLQANGHSVAVGLAPFATSTVRVLDHA